jgi:hypothetical protein
MIQLLLALVVVISAGCSIETPFGSTEIGDGKQETKDLSYEFEENGCNTGRVKYKDSQDYCNALKDNARNNYCAGSMRYDEFKRACPGQNWQ